MRLLSRMANVIRYVTVNLPVSLAEQIDMIISEKKQGYRSRNEFCLEAIRKHLRYIGHNGGSNNAILSQPSNDKEIDTNV